MNLPQMPHPVGSDSVVSVHQKRAVAFSPLECPNRIFQSAIP